MENKGPKMKWWWIAGWVLISVSVAACGQKGDLYLPDANPARQDQPTPRSTNESGVLARRTV